ncbi:class I SAM-dependent methyltransferase [Pseudorhodoplanes sp.]|uniref:class I SAM-dependent methyltransferase n=1 Tax=Pseudorhodoplanes sp. TaxID=1934341 RepID=UPI002CC9DE68|nr:class I SAM-dependent methyltransferase [Pseudorhodoplanes sp.]HWV54436.1 class I SAM-dependent methyltransferase [Pseudorhodoplanes sp.]
MTTNSGHRAEIDYLRAHYTKLAHEHADSPKAVQYSDKASHWARFAILADIGLDPMASVLDFGCGTAELLSFLRERAGFKGKYVGVDISDQQLAIARSKFPDCRFENRDVLSAGVGEVVDYIFINGVFNNRVPGADGFAYLTDILTALRPAARKGIAFNAISTYVDFFDDGLVYLDPGRVFEFCKQNLSGLVTLRHDYLLKPSAPPFEFTVYVRVSDQTPRANLKSQP